MAHDPKLELYKLRLFNKQTGQPATFRSLFRNKFDSYGKNVNDKWYFETFGSDFFNKIAQQKGYCANLKKKKGFTVAIDENAKSTKDKPKFLMQNVLEKESLISGVLEGGKHGVRRLLAD